jgi:hypothetical protein
MIVQGRLNGLTLCVLIAALALLTTTITWADVLVLKDGRKLEGKVTIKQGSYHIQMKFGSLTFKADEVAEVQRADKESGETPKKPSPGNKQEKKNPSPQLPALSAPQKANLLKALAPGSRYKESRNFAVASAASKNFTRRYSLILERVRKGFYKYFNDRGFDLKWHDAKLEAVIFKDQQSFVRFAQGFGLGSQAAGFYATATNQLYFYDNSNSQSAASSRASLKSFKRHLDSIKKQMKQAEKAGNGPAMRHLGGFYRKENKRYKKFKKRVENFIDDSNSSITIHEAVHQLCYNSGLLTISDLNPEWLTEGLAMLFEDPAVWQGRHVSKGNEYRIKSLARSLKAGRKIDLKVMVSSRTQLIARADPQFAYASSWALIHFFIVGKWRKYKAPFFEYLKAVRSMAKKQKRSARRKRNETEAQQLKLFEQKFGDLKKIEAQFRAYIKKLIEE